MIKMIVSGGQAGADQGGLFGAVKARVRTGGWAPKGWWTECGQQKSILSAYNLKEHPRNGYPARTEANVADSDGTVLFGLIQSPGSQLTKKYCLQLNKPLMHIPVVGGNIVGYTRAVDGFFEWVESNGIETLNVSGNRESKNLGIYKSVAAFIQMGVTVSE